MKDGETRRVVTTDAHCPDGKERKTPLSVDNEECTVDTIPIKDSISTTVTICLVAHETLGKKMDVVNEKRDVTSEKMNAICKTTG